MSLEVKKVIPVYLDLGNLAAFDINIPHDVITSTDRAAREARLLDLTRDNVQLLFNDLFKLPITGSDVGPIVTLPEPSTPLPRAKSIPKPKDLTRWEKFAKAKGIVKRKRSSHKFSETLREWRPRFGFKSAKNDPIANWIKELKPGQTPDNIE